MPQIAHSVCASAVAEFRVGPNAAKDLKIRKHLRLIRRYLHKNCCHAPWKPHEKSRE